MEKKQELSKQRTRLEELEALTWLEAEGVPPNDDLNAEMLTKIKAGPDEGAKVLGKLEAKVLEKAERQEERELARLEEQDLQVKKKQELELEKELTERRLMLEDLEEQALIMQSVLKEVRFWDFFNYKVPTKLEVKVLIKLEAKVLTKTEAELDGSVMEEGLRLDGPPTEPEPEDETRRDKGEGS